MTRTPANVPETDIRETTSQRRWLSPPVLLAAFGAACVLFQAWVFARWAAGGNLHSYPFNGDMPTYLKISTQVLQVLVAAACVALIVLCRRQSRAAGHVTLMTTLTAGWALAFWADPYIALHTHLISNNRYGINYPTWGPYLPGWDGPLPQPQTFLENGMYPLLVIWIWIGLAIARLLRARRPQWSRARVAGLATVILFPVDIVLEQAYIRAAGFGYARAMPYVTLFEGQWYQLPLTAATTMTLLVAPPIVVMAVYARPGREVWMLEGSLSLPHRAQPWIRLLAGVGLVHVCMVGFVVLTQLYTPLTYLIDLPPWFERPT